MTAKRDSFFSKVTGFRPETSLKLNFATGFFKGFAEKVSF